MKLKLTRGNSLKAKVNTRINAQLAATTPLTLTEANGIKTFGLSVTELRDSLDSIYATTPIDASNLPLPTSSTVGGVKSLAAVSSRWINQISTSGTPSATQPAFSDLSGGIAVSQMNSGLSASSSTYWRGDGSWATPSGSGGGSGPPQGRLTLTTGVAITTADVTSATSVYYTFACGNQLPIYDGSATAFSTFTELTLALDSDSGHTNYHQSGKNYDCFVINDTGTIRLGTGPKWDDGAVAGSNTARGTGAASTELELKNGFWTNKNTITIRFGSASGNTVSVSANRATYVGTIRMTANGTTEDSLVKRFVYNAYNQLERQLLRQEATASWNYSTASYRQANNSASNQVEYVAGLAGGPLKVSVATVILNSTSTPRIVYAGIGLDSTTVNSRTISNFNRLGDTTLASPGGPMAAYNGYAQLGYHYLAWLEKGAGSDTQTWFGVSGSDYQAGLFGGIWS